MDRAQKYGRKEKRPVDIGFSITMSYAQIKNLYRIAIPLLGLILVVQLSKQFSRPAVKDADTAVTANSCGAITETSSIGSESGTAVGSEKRNWPTYSADQVEHLNPFDRTRLIPPKELATVPTPDISDATQLVSSSAPPVERALGDVKAIYRTPSGTVAIVGEQHVRVGDILDDGSKVLAIHIDQIVTDRPSIH